MADEPALDRDRALRSYGGAAPGDVHRGPLGRPSGPLVLSAGQARALRGAGGVLVRRRVRMARLCLSATRAATRPGGWLPDRRARLGVLAPGDDVCARSA